VEGCLGYICITDEYGVVVVECEMRKNIKMIKIVINFRKKKIVPPYIIKKIPIRMRKKLNNNRDFLFLSEYPNAIYYIMNSNFSFI
jgi:hypothetical protein